MSHWTATQAFVAAATIFVQTAWSFCAIVSRPVSFVWSFVSALLIAW